MHGTGVRGLSVGRERCTCATIVCRPHRLVTIDYQRQRAKEMTKYFNNLKFQKEVSDSRCVGPMLRAAHWLWIPHARRRGLMCRWHQG